MCISYPDRWPHSQATCMFQQITLCKRFEELKFRNIAPFSVHFKLGLWSALEHKLLLLSSANFSQKFVANNLWFRVDIGVWILSAVCHPGWIYNNIMAKIKLKEKICTSHLRFLIIKRLVNECEKYHTILNSISKNWQSKTMWCQSSYIAVRTD